MDWETLETTCTEVIECLPDDMSREQLGQVVLRVLSAYEVEGDDAQDLLLRLSRIEAAVANDTAY